MGCPRCRTLNAPGARFCTACGTAFFDAIPRPERRRIAGCALMALLLALAILSAV